jgi:glycogen synthase
VERAINVWHNEKESFRQMQMRAMSARFTWGEAAKNYEEVYYWAIENR